MLLDDSIQEEGARLRSSYSRALSEGNPSRKTSRVKRLLLADKRLRFQFGNLILDRHNDLVGPDHV
jgi:hypothetical protein